MYKFLCALRLPLYSLLIPIFWFALSTPTRAGLPAGFIRSQIAQVNAATRMAFAPDGRIFVTELAGRIRVIRDGAASRLRRL